MLSSTSSGSNQNATAINFRALDENFPPYQYTLPCLHHLLINGKLTYHAESCCQLRFARSEFTVEPQISPDTMPPLSRVSKFAPVVLRMDTNRSVSQSVSHSTYRWEKSNLQPDEVFKLLMHSAAGAKLVQSTSLLRYDLHRLALRDACTMIVDEAKPAMRNRGRHMRKEESFIQSVSD